MGRTPKSAKAKAEEEKHFQQLGKHLKKLRETKNLTPQDVADKLGVTPQYIYMIESGKAKPSEARLNDLAAALGDLAGEFLVTAVGHVEEEFAAKLKEAGLSPGEIDEAARRVSARAKENVVWGKESLRVARGQASEAQILGALEAGEDIVAMQNLEVMGLAEESAADYAQSVKQKFEANHSRSAAAAAHASKASTQSPQLIKAGSHAHIVVDRPVTRKEQKALIDIGRVIAHMLSK